jgi:hypothetical protein
MIIGPGYISRPIIQSCDSPGEKDIVFKVDVLL